jgi:Zn-dependent protease
LKSGVLSQKQSFHLATISGIPILIHWTFGLFIAFIIYTAWNNNFSTADGFWFVIFVCILFLFVVLHELGHAMAARKYGILTKDIIISPIGGIARLMDIPRKPAHELVVALAGPAVNVILAVLFLLLLLPITNNFFPQKQSMNLISEPVDYLRYLLIINVTLVVFNMIPAFPMDGGRVFRALLAFKMPRLRATYVAMIIARIFAILFISYGVYSAHLILTLIGGFILFTSGSEYKQVYTDYLFQNHTARDVLIKNPITLLPNLTFSDVFKIASSAQGNFPVYNMNGLSMGVLTSPAISYAKENNLDEVEIVSYLSNVHGSVSENMNLKSVFSLMDSNGWYTADVLTLELDKIGILDRKSLENYIRNHNRKK